jgi:hypothetical protein
VQDVDTPHVMAILKPIWKATTAVRLRGHLEAILDWATVRGYRAGPNPARWKGHLSVMLPAPSKVANAEHHAALPYSEMRGRLRRQDVDSPRRTHEGKEASSGTTLGWRWRASRRPAQVPAKRQRLLRGAL